MFKNFWYACGQTSSITETPRKLKIIGQNLVAYRNEEGHAVVMSDLCIHRGGALSSGWVEDGCLRCPYHGWKYDKEGKCVEIPANGKDKPIPSRARVDTYPTAEKYGFTWVFLGDLPEEVRPPVPEFPQWDEDMRATYGEYTWNAHFRRVVENSLDSAHASWVHKNSFGSNQNPEIPDFTIEKSAWGAGAQLNLFSPKLKGLWGRKREVINKVEIYNAFSMPNVTTVLMKFGKMQTRLYNVSVPVDEETTLTHWVILRDFFKSPFFDSDTRRRTLKIFYEDAPIVCNQRPELIPEEISAELHVKSDALQIEYRRFCEEVIRRGWSIDMDQHRTLEGKTATIIPSPARYDGSSKKNHWVFPEVPMNPATAAEDDSAPASPARMPVEPAAAATADQNVN